jgi:hypothetical protein
MCAGPGLPCRVGSPIATRTAIRSASTAGSWEILTTCCAESRLRGSSRGLTCVGTALCDHLVGRVFVGLIAARVGDTLVEGVEGVAGAEGGIVFGAAAQILPA